MEINFHSTVIFVQDIEISKKFYCDILKQTIIEDFGAVITLKNGLSLWQIPKKHPLKNEFYAAHKGNRSMEICFETEKIDEIVEQIKLKKIPKLHDLTEEPWGQRTIRFFDPDKNLVEIGETLPVFINRMKNNGLSADEINQKTGVPVKKIDDLIKKQSHV
ncbi:MAG: VOC family protein [Bacteroidales bacterium]